MTINTKLSPIDELSKWVYLHPDAHKVPDHLYYPAERQSKGDTFEPTDLAQATVTSEINDEIKKHLTDGVYLDHREVEKQIADYLEIHRLYPKLQDALRGCRQTGTLGYVHNNDGSVSKRVIFDNKCNILRLCPDESRDEQRRLIERYSPIIETWQQRTSGQIQYCVLTWPNVTAGKLHYYKREMMAQLAKLRTLPEFKAVKGILTGQEDPLAKDGETWNLHLNLLMMVRGHFDWKAARAAWFALTRHLFKDQVRDKNYKDFNVHFQNVSTKKLSNAIIELIKYPVKHISKKQLLDKNENSKADPEQAPPLTSWHPERFREWWEAGRGFRRTRSYGLLHSLDSTKWGALMTRNQRDEILFDLGIDASLTKTKWRKIPKETREEIKPFLTPAVIDDKDDRTVTWIGRFKFQDGLIKTTTFHIDLIQGDNSGLNFPKINQNIGHGAQAPP